MTEGQFCTLSCLYTEFEHVCNDIRERLQRLSDTNITGMTPLGLIKNEVVFECVRLAFRMDKKVLLVDEEERERMCVAAVKRRKAEIQAEEDALERGRERNRIEMEKRDEQRERKLYKQLHKKYGKKRPRGR